MEWKTVTWFVNYNEQAGAQRSHNVKMFNRLKDAKEFCKTTGSGYITAQDKEQRLKLIGFFGDFKPSATEQDLISKIVTAE